MPETPKIVPVIMCGGSGTRLWPTSRKSYPKQFASLIGKGSLLEQTLQRFDKPGFAPPLVITSEPFRFIVTALTESMGLKDPLVIVEPAARNTAPAALAAAFRIMEQDPNALMLLAPSDHLIRDTAAFHVAVARGIAAAQDGRIVTFGVTPARAETGYGYLELSGTDTGGPPLPVKRFVEKPDRAAAEAMLADGAYLWNSGMFLARAETLIEAFSTHAPEYIEPVSRAVYEAAPDLDFIRLAADPWSEVPAKSIDYAIMERADNIVACALSAGWADLGSWDAVWQESERNADGVATGGPVTAIGCRNSLLRSESDELELVALGLENIIAIAMKDAVLIADRTRGQDVKEVVTRLKQRGAPQAEQLPRDYRPWGWYESLVVGDRFQVKRIVVDPGATLSLQSHVHRSEHWIVVQGTAKVTIDDDVRLVGENQSAYIPLGAVHRMENPGKVPLVLIEVQTGTYLGEDDITRYEDKYQRL
ncbi:mannose-1-phosphate guanylyltransferase/mannose-6-phosphate isomerase [Oceanibium sediminis]|uniref:mannose-1-phosphate guanylyltransferase/mannose-6-phosphate isomerase n=1 Tax=Oceanibium sediminis TaxID=2026339 RepID=UPI000DD46B2B|nr:mannose-1-phosphate guanylyltransferase/mannose-6-phosphate isomerase [Oceanibium sediminis]